LQKKKLKISGDPARPKIGGCGCKPDPIVVGLAVKQTQQHFFY